MLENVVIPRLEGNIKFISGTLEEHEREEFTRLKVIKRMKVKNSLMLFVSAAFSRPRPSQTEKRPFPAKAIAPGGASRAYRGRWFS